MRCGISGIELNSSLVLLFSREPIPLIRVVIICERRVCVGKSFLKLKGFRKSHLGFRKSLVRREKPPNILNLIGSVIKRLAQVPADQRLVG